VAPAGVRVTIVEPGTFATDFASTAHVVATDEVYARTVGEFLTGFAALPPSAFGDSPPLASRSPRLYAHRGIFASTSRHLTIDKTPTRTGRTRS
jgi:NAD(P)-dependent dehydrogenase (short-subunit alcohol dehydrogenase family)